MPAIRRFKAFIALQLAILGEYYVQAGRLHVHVRVEYPHISSYPRSPYQPRNRYECGDDLVVRRLCVGCAMLHHMRERDIT
ncbi:hypothetical protein V8C42DRAFT_306499 [Trichoderma barbatum]